MKIKQKLAWLLAVTAVLSCAAGCGKKPAQIQYEVPNNQGLLEEGQEKSEYNKELFYRNDKFGNCADPFIMDNTSRDGYYYLYGTEGSLFVYRSMDLMNWERVGNSLDNLEYGKTGGVTETRRVTWKDIWAPEVIYDPDTNLYYMFFSATPQEDTSVKPGKGIREGSPNEITLVAVSQRPDRDFQLVNFKDPASCGEENLHTYNTNANLKDANGEYVNAYPHYFAKYMLFNPEQYKAFSDANGGYRGQVKGGFEGGIDPHPYVDENGDKWLFWVDCYGSDRICCVKMENWLKPDWSTAKALLYHTYYTVEDWKAAQSGAAVELVPYELQGTSINEGPCVVKHNGKFYLTFSIGAYSDNSYQVVQAVSDNLDGPYRKLTLEEGAILISGELSGSQEVSGPGHHGFVNVGEQTFIVYHRHNDVIAAGGARNPAIDEIKWITVKDKFGKDMDVMYTNGPTVSPQPKVEAYAEYVNIADEAKISGSKDTKYLTDGLLSVYKYLNETMAQYVQETTITDTTTFTFDFAEARTVRAIMVYNSKMEDTAFSEIAKVEFVCIENGAEVVRYIEDVQRLEVPDFSALFTAP